MSGPVHLQSVEVLEYCRSALLTFQEEAQAVVNGTEMDLRRAWHWLDHEMPAHWHSCIKRLEVDLSEANNALFRKRLQAQGTDRPAFDTVEKMEVKRLEAELEKAKAKLDVIRRWRTQFERAMNEFNARTRGLKDEVGGGIERHTEYLNALIQSISEYSAMNAPQAPRSQSSSGSNETPSSDETEQPQ